MYRCLRLDIRICLQTSWFCDTTMMNFIPALTVLSFKVSIISMSPHQWAKCFTAVRSSVCITKHFSAKQLDQPLQCTQSYTLYCTTVASVCTQTYSCVCAAFAPRTITSKPCPTFLPRLRAVIHAMKHRVAVLPIQPRQRALALTLNEQKGQTHRKKASIADSGSQADCCCARS